MGAKTSEGFTIAPSAMRPGETPDEALARMRREGEALSPLVWICIEQDDAGRISHVELLDREPKPSFYWSPDGDGDSPRWTVRAGYINGGDSSEERAPLTAGVMVDLVGAGDLLAKMRQDLREFGDPDADVDDREMAESWIGSALSNMIDNLYDSY